MTHLELKSDKLSPEVQDTLHEWAQEVFADKAWQNTMRLWKEKMWVERREDNDRLLHPGVS